MKRIEPESNARKIAIKAPAKVTNGHSNKQAIDVETHNKGEDK